MPRRDSWVDMTPEPFMVKLAALVPPPRIDMVRDAGVFASHHHLRPLIVPRPANTEPQPPSELDLFEVCGAAVSLPRAERRARTKRLSRSALLARVFEIDIEQCPRCDGRLRLTEVVTAPDEIAALLDGARAPPRPAPVGQLRLL